MAIARGVRRHLKALLGFGAQGSEPQTNSTSPKPYKLKQNSSILPTLDDINPALPIIRNTIILIV